MNVKKKYSYLLFRHYGQGFLFLVFLFYSFLLVRLGFNHMNDLFYLSFRGKDGISQISIVSTFLMVMPTIFILCCFSYAATSDMKYFKKAIRIIASIYIVIGLFGVVDLISIQSSALYYVKNVLISVFTWLLYRRYVAIEDKKLFNEIFPASGNANRITLIRLIPNIATDWKPYIKNIKGQREKTTVQTLIPGENVWGLERKTDFFEISFKVRFLPVWLKIADFIPIVSPTSLGRQLKEEK